MLTALFFIALKGKAYNLNPGTGAFVSRKKTPLV